MLLWTKKRFCRVLIQQLQERDRTSMGSQNQGQMKLLIVLMALVLALSASDGIREEQ